jgi:magnesium transporter
VKIDRAERSTGALTILATPGGRFTESRSLDDLPALLSGDSPCVWVDLVDPSPNDVRAVAGALGLHPLIAEDITESNERAKVEHVGEVIHLVLFALSRNGAIVADEIDFVLGPGFLLTVHSGSWDPREAHQLKMGEADVASKGPDHLLWALSDSIVDGYFPIFDQLADEIEELQDRVIARPNPATVERVFSLRRELIRVRHVLGPSREIFNQLTSREYPVIKEAQVLYFRDIYDHLIRLTDDFDTYRELVAATVEVYLSTVNNNLSEIMKRLTGVTVILAGLGALAGIFGMSEASSSVAGTEGIGFWIITVAMLALAGFAIVLLRRIDWL